MNGYTVILFYKYVRIEDPEALARAQEELCASLGLRGRLIVAREGVNGTFEGTAGAIDRYVAELTTDPRFADVQFKRSAGTGAAMPKLSVKVRDEIVSAHLGDADVDPRKVTGKRLSPETLREWFESGKKFHIVDVRNEYECTVGRFRGSVLSGMGNFRDLPQVPSRIAHLKSEPVLTVCTGGVRCEKASGYLVEQGFSDVYQLDGGIVSYMERYPGTDFEGALYVFDNRVTVHFDAPGSHAAVGACVFCSQPCERYINCKDDECHLHFIACASCVERDMGRLCPDCAAVQP